jgi:DNA-binding transcriptional LysR family regulator
MGIVDDLILFAEIVTAGGLTAASRKISISKSTLSRRMDDLETALGVHLLHRGPKRFSATEVGFSVYERGLKIKDELKIVTGMVEAYSTHRLAATGAELDESLALSAFGCGRFSRRQIKGELFIPR